MREYTKITPTRNSFWNHNIFSYLNAGSRSPLSYLFIPLVKLFATLFSIIHSTYFQQETQLLNSLKQLGPSKLRQKSPQQLQLLVQQSSGISIYVSDVQKWCWCLKMRSCNGREGCCHKRIYPSPHTVPIAWFWGWRFLVWLLVWWAIQLSGLTSGNDCKGRKNSRSEQLWVILEDCV